MRRWSVDVRDGRSEDDGRDSRPGRPDTGRRHAVCRAGLALAASWCAATGIARAGDRAPGAAALPVTPWLGPSDRLIDLRDPRQQPLDERLLRERLATTDLLLLGERHDEPEHHVRRGALLLALARQPAGPAAAGAARQRLGVVAEQLLQGRQIPSADAATQGPSALLARLQAAGFDPRIWGWPLYEPLFDPLDLGRRDGLAVEFGGANLPLEQVRRVVREGESALPPALLALLQAAPLGPVARSRLDADLRDSHCGQMPEARLPGMRLAQRARDAAMWQALAAARQRTDLAVLLAGNGHVRLDYGVPVLAAAAQPGWRVLSVGFGVVGEPADGPYDLLWQTPGRPAEDPCVPPPPPSAPPSPLPSARPDA
ncbi:MAG: hypothetical protein RIQ53_4102 [Pseudomonadota bacterium]